MSNVAVIEKELGRRITQEENRLETVKEELRKAEQTLEAIKGQVEKKSSDFDIYINQKDAEIKTSYRALAEQQAQMAKDKADFQEILKQHQFEKSNFQTEKNLFSLEKQKHIATTKNVQEFITAVRRAVGLLGI